MQYDGFKPVSLHEVSTSWGRKKTQPQNPNKIHKQTKPQPKKTTQLHLHTEA